MPADWRSVLRHLAVATPWALLVGAATLVAGCVTLVARWPDALWPLHGMALGVVVGTAAVAVDERAALLVDVCPRPLWWRTAVRAWGPVSLALVWVTLHAALRADLPARLDVLVLQGLVASALGFGMATAGRAAGRAEPGIVVAVTAVPLVAGAALARPFEADLPLFPVWPHEDWERAALLWAALGVTALSVLTLALWHDGRPAPRRRSVAPNRLA